MIAMLVLAIITNAQLGTVSQGYTDTLMQAPGDTIIYMLAAITQSTEA